MFFNLPLSFIKSSTTVFVMLEGVTHAKIERRIGPSQVVNPSLTGRTVRVMELNTPVETQHGKFDIETDTQTGIKTELLVEIIEVEDRLLGILGRIGLHVPDISQVEEGGTMYNAPNRETKLQVGLELHITELV